MKLDLAPQYKIENADEVAQFIAEYPALLPLLDEAPEHIAKYFPDSELSLYVYLDRETPEGNDLVVLISTRLQDPKDVSHRFDLLFDKWGMQAMDVSDGKLRLNIGFL